MSRLAFAVPLSSNAKIGQCATTYAAQQSCPAACVFKDGGGCYAESGRISMYTNPLNAAGDELQADPVAVATAEAASIDALEVPDGRAMRLHTVGDCATDDAARIVAAACERYTARGGGPVWTYTHAWRDVARASWGCVSVLASCETPADVEAAKERGYAPSIVVTEFASHRLYEIAADVCRGTSGAKGAGGVLPCPAQTHDDTACTDCRLCWDDTALLRRGYAIGFAVHGTALAVKKAKLALDDPTNPRRRLTSRNYIAGFRAEHGVWPTASQVMAGADVTHSSAYQMLGKMQAALREGG